MTVKELLAQLATADPEAEVMVMTFEDMPEAVSHADEAIYHEATNSTADGNNGYQGHSKGRFAPDGWRTCVRLWTE